MQWPKHKITCPRSKNLIDKFDKSTRQTHVTVPA